MNRITRLFDTKKSDILNIYFTAGYPKLSDTEGVLKALSESGVDLIEIGMPYSDPLADGPTIQESGAAALSNGMSLDLLFEQISEARQSIDTPFILMGYYNQVLQYGDRRFFERCQEVGVDGLILPDLPLDVYEKAYASLIKALGLTISFLITPQTPEARIRKIDALSTGFIYMVSSYAITGTKTGISAEQIAYFERVSALKLRQPRLIGFGISDKTTYETACGHAQGAIIGSAFIKALTAGAAAGEDLTDTTHRFVRGIRP